MTAVGTPVTRPWPRGGIFKLLPDGPWFVPSRSSRGVFYRVGWGHDPKLGVFFTCTCPVGERRSPMGAVHRGLEAPCKHVGFVFEAENDDGIPARPRGGIGDTGRFVD